MAGRMIELDRIPKVEIHSSMNWNTFSRSESQERMLREYPRLHILASEDSSSSRSRGWQLGYIVKTISIKKYIKYYREGRSHVNGFSRKIFETPTRERLRRENRRWLSLTMNRCRSHWWGASCQDRGVQEASRTIREDMMKVLWL